MTPERAKELLPIIEAFSRGEAIQYQSRYKSIGEWEDSTDPLWNSCGQYRIKPEELVTSDNVPGFRALVGEEKYHYDQIPLWRLSGLRPLLLNEEIERGDQCILKNCIGNRQTSLKFAIGLIGRPALKEGSYAVFTNRPLPTLPKPKKKVPLTPADYPHDVVFLLPGSSPHAKCYPSLIVDDFVKIAWSGEEMSHRNIMDDGWLYHSPSKFGNDADGNPIFKPCYKEVEE